MRAPPEHQTTISGSRLLRQRSMARATIAAATRTDADSAVPFSAYLCSLSIIRADQRNLKSRGKRELPPP